MQRMVRLKADLLCELVAVCFFALHCIHSISHHNSTSALQISIQRSEFDAAEAHLNGLLFLTDAHDLFHSYSARITLHAAHLAHALGDAERAGMCYRVARAVDDELNAGAGFVGAAACAGEALLRIGLRAEYQGGPKKRVPQVNEATGDWLDSETHALAKSAIQRCHGMGGTFEAVGKLVQAAVAGARGEIVGAKCVFLSYPPVLYPFFYKTILTARTLDYYFNDRSHLKSALSLSTLAGENHLRALLLAQVGAQYLHTAPSHAMETLAVCETLGAGMGAKQKEVAGKGEDKDKVSTDGKYEPVGNAPLRLWVGERFLGKCFPISLSLYADETALAEIFKRADQPHRVAKQDAYNMVYRSAVEGMKGRARWPSAMGSSVEGQPPEERLLQENIKMQNVDLVSGM